MADILVVKVNMFMRSKELQEINRYIRDSMKTGVVVLPPYCDAQVIPDGVEIKIEDLNGRRVSDEQTNHSR